MKKALLVVDYTVDFVAEDGALTCGLPGIELESYICKITEQFIKDGAYVVFPVDVHELHDLYQQYAEDIFWMDKTRYSVFAGTDLELRLRARNIREIHLVGVCTDICILHSAIDAYNKGFDIVIHEQGVASFNQMGHEWAINHFEQTLGATVIRK